MRKTTGISALVLTSILIFSCATDRIQVSQKESLDCKTPNTRYDLGKKKPSLALRSNSREYSRNPNNAPVNNPLKGYSSKVIAGKDKHPGKNINAPEVIPNAPVVAHTGINEAMFIPRVPKTPDINLFQSELKLVPDQAQSLNNPGNYTLIPEDKADRKSSGPLISLKQDPADYVLQDESTVEIRTVSDTEKPDQSQSSPFRRSEAFIFMMAFLAGLIPLAAIKASPKLSADISFWAASNPWKTRLMFAVAQVGLATSGILLGGSLADNGIHFSALSRDVLIAVFLTSSFFYPVKGTSITLFRQSYLKQKAFDLALAISGFMLMVNAGNDPALRASLTRMVNLKGTELQNVKILDQSQSSTHLMAYQNSAQLQEKQMVPKEKDPERSSKILQTVLVSLLFVVLGFLVAAAACGLSCNGLVGLAWLTGIGGGALLIGLLIWSIKGIWHPNGRKKIRHPGTSPQAGTLQT